MRPAIGHATAAQTTSVAITRARPPIGESAIPKARKSAAANDAVIAQGTSERR